MGKTIEQQQHPMLALFAAREAELFEAYRDQNGKQSLEVFRQEAVIMDDNLSAAYLFGEEDRAVAWERYVLALLAFNPKVTRREASRVFFAIDEVASYT